MYIVHSQKPCDEIVWSMSFCPHKLRVSQWAIIIIILKFHTKYFVVHFLLLLLVFVLLLSLFGAIHLSRMYHVGLFICSNNLIAIPTLSQLILSFHAVSRLIEREKVNSILYFFFLSVVGAVVGRYYFFPFNLLCRFSVNLIYLDSEGVNIESEAIKYWTFCSKINFELQLNFVMQFNIGKKRREHNGVKMRNNNSPVLRAQQSQARSSK